MSIARDEQDAGDEPEQLPRKDDKKQPPIVVKPGRMHASAAYREGREDEYIDRMRSLYGGEW